MRLIDADALKEVLHETIADEDRAKYWYDLIGVDEAINDAPTIDPVRRGKWVRDDIDKWRCSECGVGNNYAYKWSVSGDELQDKYCPNCGARMDGGEDE